MLEFLFLILMIIVFGKLFVFGVKATWGITKFLVTVVFLPLILTALFLGGLVSLALPILVVVGVFSMFCTS